VTAPLYKLLKKNDKFIFGETELKAFTTLKSKLIESPVLGIYNPNDRNRITY